MLRSDCHTLRSNCRSTSAKFGLRHNGFPRLPLKANEKSKRRLLHQDVTALIRRLRAQALRPGLPEPIPVRSYQFIDRFSPPLRPDDEDGHYVCEEGENISSRYKILSKKGEGTFGRVFECWDRHRLDYVAIKIIKNIDKYRHAAMLELEVLNTLEQNDPEGSKNCVALREWFDYRGHVCMVFEKLGHSLYDFMRLNEFRPFPIDLVQRFARQLVRAVAYMHELQLVHTDLKPENILLTSDDYYRYCLGSGPNLDHRVIPASTTIKLIDFGSAVFQEGHHSRVVSTRHYRAPEIILGLGWSHPCDMWSLGCILVELLTGDALFQVHENLEHLKMMEQVLGPMPVDMVKRGSRAAPAYFMDNRLKPLEDPKSQRAVSRLRDLRRFILNHGDSTAVPYIEELEDLLRKMMRFDPSDRITAQEALDHPFLLHTITSPSPQQEPPKPHSIPSSYAVYPQQRRPPHPGLVFHPYPQPPPANLELLAVPTAAMAAAPPAGTFSHYPHSQAQLHQQQQQQQQGHLGGGGSSLYGPW